MKQLWSLVRMKQQNRSTRRPWSTLIQLKLLCTSQDQQNPSLRKHRSEEHTSELQSLMRISYAVFCLKKKKKTNELPHYSDYRQQKPRRIRSTVPDTIAS